MKIGFIGLGNMGLPMATHLVDAGFDVIGFDVVDEQLEEFEENGGEAAATAAEAAESASVVITMVRTPEQVKAITEDIFDVMDEGTLFVNTSTSGPKASKEIRPEAEERGIRMIDAPVSGGAKGAQAGTLTIMAGGEDDDLDEVDDVFAAFGESDSIYHVGGHGTGQTAKLSLQVLVSAEIASICEAFRLADGSGIDRELLYDILTDSVGTSGVLELKGEMVVEENFEPDANIHLQEKDMRLVMDAAEDMSIPLPLSSVATQEFIHAQSRGLGDLDTFALYKLYE